jgi:PAS domain S-box-containing protein
MVLAVARDITERKDAEKAVQASERRYHRHVERNAAAFICTTLDGRLVECNDAAVRFFGYESQEELLSLAATQLNFDPADRQAVIDLLEEHKALNNYEICWKRKDGSPVWGLMNMTLVKGEDGGVLVEGTAIDITERKRMEKDLRMIASVVESSTDFIGFASMEGSVLFLNPAARLMLGLDRDEPVTGVSLLNYVMDEDREWVRERVLPAVMRDGRWEGETRFKHQETGAPIPVWQSIFFITEQRTNRRIALATICRDITERKRAEEALRASEERYRMLAHALQSTGECISITDTEDRILYVNDAFLRTYGYEEHELVGHHIGILWSARTATEIQNGILPATMAGKWCGELWNRTKEGREFPISLSTSVVYDERRRCIALVGVARDITERKQAE